MSNLYNRPRVTLQNALEHTEHFTLRTLLYGDNNLHADLTVNKRITTEALRFNGSDSICMTA